MSLRLSVEQMSRLSSYMEVRLKTGRGSYICPAAFSKLSVQVADIKGMIAKSVKHRDTQCLDMAHEASGR